MTYFGEVKHLLISTFQAKRMQLIQDLPDPLSDVSNMCHDTTWSPSDHSLPLWNSLLHRKIRLFTVSLENLDCPVCHVCLPYLLTRHISSIAYTLLFHCLYFAFPCCLHYLGGINRTSINQKSVGNPNPLEIDQWKITI